MFSQHTLPKFTASIFAILTALSLPVAFAEPVERSQHTAVLEEFYDWWSPSTFDDSNDVTRLATAFKGSVTNPGNLILSQNDRYTQEINLMGAGSPDQQQRALNDAYVDGALTFSDSFGPVLGGYLTDGIKSDDLPLTSSAIERASEDDSTGAAKADFNFPRPFLRSSDADRGGVGDRSRNGDSNLGDLMPDLDIQRVLRPGQDENSVTVYDAFAGVGPHGLGALSQSFPSGHTTNAYSISLELAALLPELAPEILARGSEAGNNRIVLGVHYPLDVVGGRILGHINAANRFSSGDYVSSVLAPAREELVRYLEIRCDLDGYGGSLEICIERTGANGSSGYKNYFTDSISTSPVVDRGSSLSAYAARMTYDLYSTGDSGSPAIVPEDAAFLISTAFPELSDDQRRDVLAKTSIDSGAPLDKSSGGWQRINLAAAMSAKVTLASNGSVVKVEPGQDFPSTVTLPGAFVHSRSER